MDSLSHRVVIMTVLLTGLLCDCTEDNHGDIREITASLTNGGKALNTGYLINCGTVFDGVSMCRKGASILEKKMK